MYMTLPENEAYGFENIRVMSYASIRNMLPGFA